MNEVVQTKNLDAMTFLRDPAQHEKLQSYIDEAILCLSKIDDQKLQLRAVKEAAVSELGINKADLNFLIGLYKKNDFADKKAEIDKKSEVLDFLTANND